LLRSSGDKWQRPAPSFLFSSVVIFLQYQHFSNWFTFLGSIPLQSYSKVNGERDELLKDEPASQNHHFPELIQLLINLIKLEEKKEKYWLTKQENTERGAAVLCEWLVNMQGIYLTRKQKHVQAGHTSSKKVFHIVHQYTKKLNNNQNTLINNLEFCSEQFILNRSQYIVL
jgi:hypothetical protein